MKFPKWLRKNLPEKSFFSLKKDLEKFSINTVCENAKCPNIYECFQKKHATFLALGNSCTRKCKFCNISYKKNPIPPDAQEPKKIAIFAKKMKLKHIVITMVTRDDLKDCGANHMASIIKTVKKYNPFASIEVLTSDFLGIFKNVDIILKQDIKIFSHNLETVRSLTPVIRNKASYERSLSILEYAKKNSPHLIKSSIMVGLGETFDQVLETIYDLKKINCDIINIGQYLQPSKDNIKVKEYIHPKIFDKYKKYALSIGIKKIFSAPFIRSSYYIENI